MIKTIITDIEGTTSSLSFVKDILFPYAREHIADYVKQRAEEEPVQQQLNAVKEIMGNNPDIEHTAQQLVAWIDQDQKVTPLKTLQGMIWETGYRNGDFTGHVYEDAYLKLKRWHEQGINVFIYSSGSVYAQKLLYGYSDFGDITSLFSGYFDTNIGHKRETTSYKNIIKTINCDGESTLFLSDIVEELDAAKAAGINTYWLIREGEAPSAPPHQIARTFDDISI